MLFLSPFQHLIDEELYFLAEEKTLTGNLKCQVSYFFLLITCYR